jgi:predicted CopG family antitoxin
MPKTVGPKEDTKAFTVMIPTDVYNDLLKDGEENERTLSQTIRWILKKYVENKKKERS